jgi:hypothetical protein
MGNAKPEVQVLLRLPGRLHAELGVQRPRWRPRRQQAQVR